MVCYYLTVLAVFWPLAVHRAESFLFSAPPFQDRRSAACVEKQCPLSMAFDKIIYIMKHRIVFFFSLQTGSY